MGGGEAKRMWSENGANPNRSDELLQSASPLTRSPTGTPRKNERGQRRTVQSDGGGR